MRSMFVGLMVAGLAGFAAAQEGDHRHMHGMHETPAPAVAPKAKAVKTLTAGSYTASVKSLPCSACGPKVVETMKAFPGVADAAVDQDKSKLTFAVKKGAKVEVEALQKRLAAVSGQMGMGADYTLYDIQAAAKAP